VLGRSCHLVSGGLAGTAVLLDLEVDLLAFRQALHPGALDGGDVDENVRSAGVRLDEAKAFGGVEPLYGSSCHGSSSCLRRCRCGEV
jgi:hypothetical protein